MSNRTYYSHDAEMRANRERMTMTSFYMVVALAVGALLALLFAPTTGEKMRDELGHAVGEGLHNGREAIEPAIEQLNKEMKDLRSKVEDRLG